MAKKGEFLEVPPLSLPVGPRGGLDLVTNIQGAGAI